MATDDKTVNVEDSRVQEAMLAAYIDEVKAGLDRETGEVVISRDKTDEAELTTFVTDRDNVDKVTVYSQHDGVASRVLVSMLTSVLKKRLPRIENIPQKLWGKRAFGMERPAGWKDRPRFKCALHPEGDRRDEFNAMGLQFVTCSKDNLASALDARMHFERRHPNTYKMVTEYDVRKREEERDARDKASVAALVALAEKSATVGAATPAPVAAAPAAEPKTKPTAKE